MTSFLAQPELKYVGVAVFMIGAAYGIMKWVGKTLREQLGPGIARPGEGPTISHVDSVPPALVKAAIERGLVTASQLAAMAPMERQFLFASLRERLAVPAVSAEPGHGAAPQPARAAVAPRAMDGAEFGLASMPVNERLKLHCPTCGEALTLPAFAPFVAHCASCGTKTALREDVPGHFLLNVSPARTAEPRKEQRGPSLV